MWQECVQREDRQDRLGYMVVRIVEFTWLDLVIYFSLLTLVCQLKDSFKRPSPRLNNLLPLNLSLSWFHGGHLIFDLQEKAILDFFVSRISVIILFEPFVYEPDVIILWIINSILPLEMEWPRIYKPNWVRNVLPRRSSSIPSDNANLCLITVVHLNHIFEIDNMS